MKTERIQDLPRNEVREFYYTYLKLPYPECETNHVPHELDPTVEQVIEVISVDGIHPLAFVILREDNTVEVVDAQTGEHVRLLLGEMTNTERPEIERAEALVQVALLDSKMISKGFAEIISYLQRKEYLTAFGTFQGLSYRVRFLGTILETATRQHTANG